MPRTIVCTTGTSIARGCNALAELQTRTSDWNDDTTNLQHQIKERLATFDLNTERARIQCCAESHSLLRLGVSPEDHIVLLVTDTADGHACADGVKQALCAAFHLPHDNVSIKRIQGLQVRDAERLRKVGLLQFTETLVNYAQDTQLRNTGEVIFNPTGGYKGVVPFMAVIGMLFRLRTVYVFESSASLITLPPLPITFDLALYQRALPALHAVRAEGAIHEAQFYKRIAGYAPHERMLFSGFIEQDNEWVTLSPLATALVAVQESGAKQIWLSNQAAECLTQHTAEPRLALERFLAKLSDPLWRSMHFHSFAATDLDVFKPGDTAARAACIIKDDRVYVCRLYEDHDFYERDLARRTRAQFDLNTFVRWQPDDDLPRLEAHWRDTQYARIAQLEQECQILQRQLKQASRPRKKPPAPYVMKKRKAPKTERR